MDWLLGFDAASRLFWLSIFWLFLEATTRIIAYRNETFSDQPRKIQDHGSWWLIALMSFFMSLIILGIVYKKPTPNLPSYFIPIGVLLMGLGIALRIWAVITLGKFFTMKVTIFSSHHLIDRGPYSVLRHPSYTGVLLTALGFGLASGYFFFLMAFLIILILGLGYRIYIEEKALKEEFGEEWATYSARTWKIFPWVF